MWAITQFHHLNVAAACGNSRLAPNTAKQEALIMAEVHWHSPQPVTLILRIINIIHRLLPIRHSSSCFLPCTYLQLFREFFMGSAVAHNKHGSLRSHCTYCQLQFHRCHFPSLTKIHSWSTPRTSKCNNYGKIKISGPYYPRRGLRLLSAVHIPVSC